MQQLCVVICNYNKKDYVLGAIASVYATAPAVADVMVVDNASTDGSVAAIRDAYPGVTLFSLPENIGGAGGFAYGMERAHAAGYPYVALLDNDAVVTDGCLLGMMAILAKDQSLGVVGPAMCKMDTPDVIQEVGAVIDINECSFHRNFLNEPYVEFGSELLECDYVPACCLMTRRDVLDRIGYFDVDFFLYWDDIDWCVRAKDAGYRVVAAPQLRALHKGGGGSTTSTLPRYYYWRNKLYFFRKHGRRYPRAQVVAKLSASVAKSITFQMLTDSEALLVPMQLALADAQSGVVGPYSGQVALPQYQSAKYQLLTARFPPAAYRLQLDPMLANAGNLQQALFMLRRFIEMSRLFAEPGYRWYLDASLWMNVVEEVAATGPENVHLYAGQPDAVTTIVVHHHLFLEERPAADHTDMLWNVLPEHLDGHRALRLAQLINESQQAILHFFDV